MARTFVVASTQYAKNNSSIITGAPYTMAGFFRSTSSSTRQVIMALSDTGTTTEYMEMVANGSTAGDPVSLRRASAIGGADIASSSTGYSINTWHHAACRASSATSADAYIDGGSKGSNTSSNTPLGIDTVNIGGKEILGANDNHFAGRLAELGIWNVALTDEEIAALAKGSSPLRIRPESLKGYWPFYGVGSPEPDYSSAGQHMTLVNTPAQGDHCPYIRPAFGYDLGWQGEFTPAAAGGSAFPWHYYQQMRA